jgi:hypothetical protein
METANFMLLEDKVPVYSAADPTSVEITKLNSGDEIICDEKVKKNQVQMVSVVLSDGRKGYIRAETKGIGISLAVLKQSSADVFEAPDASSKIVSVYGRGDKFQIIGGVKQDNLTWVKTESLAGTVGFIQGEVKVEEVIQLTPSQKWPARGGYIGAGIGVAAAFYFSFFSDGYHPVIVGMGRGSVVIFFFAGFITGYLFTYLFIKIKHSIAQ